MLGLDDSNAWTQFMSDTLPGLRDGGWRVEMSEDFRFNVIEIDSIDVDLATINNGANLLNVNSFWQRIITGALIILIVFFDQLRRRRR